MNIPTPNAPRGAKSFGYRTGKALSIVWVAALLSACNDRDTTPTGITQTEAIGGARIAAVVTLPEPFTARAPLDPFFFNQPSEVMMRAEARRDFAIQRLVTSPTAPQFWHTHPGPNFAIVERGKIRITRYSKKYGCVSTVYGPGELAGATYFEEAGEVHRADVVGEETVVEYKARFYTPAGEPFGRNVTEDPVC
jgi:quercetin dioxygenase-like cupin family protein